MLHVNDLLMMTQRAAKLGCGKHPRMTDRDRAWSKAMRTQAPWRRKTGLRMKLRKGVDPHLICGWVEEQPQAEAEGAGDG